MDESGNLLSQYAIREKYDMNLGVDFLSYYNLRHAILYAWRRTMIENDVPEDIAVNFKVHINNKAVPI